MKLQRNPVAAAVALALIGAISKAQAQTPQPAPPAAPASAPTATEPPPAAPAAPTPPAATPPAPSAPAGPGLTTTLQPVEVRGIRSSLQQSLKRKRDSDSVVEVITAEDIGKMPDKNIADSLQRVPGVTISSASASEGGFDENDRVSIRGTAPSLTQTMINGHMVGSGDWFVLNQVGTVGRSVSYSLLPSELVGSVVVRKSYSADLVEGGVAGTVDILTRRPLDFRKPFTIEAAAGLVHATLPDKTDPQFSGTVNWRNEPGTMGLLVQGFYQKRHLRRDGQETLGYGTIGPGNPLLATNPDLLGVAFPNVVGATLFEQVRERTGALIDFQIKPINSLTLDLSAFKSHMKATNYNRNWMLWVNRALNGSGAGTATEQFPQAPDPGYVIRNGTLVSGTWTPRLRADGSAAQYALVDNIYRPGANSDTSFYDFDTQWRANDRLTLSSKVGVSTGKGETPKQAVFSGNVFGTGARYGINGTGGPIDTAVLAGNPASFTGTALDFVFGASPAKTKDREKYAQLDGEYALEWGPITSVKTGVRFAEHTRDQTWVAQGPLAAAFTTLPAWNGETYPGNFGKGLGGNTLRNVWQLDPGVLEAWGDQFSNRDPVARQFFQGEFALKEKNGGAYVMANLEGRGWRGNVGARLVRTREQVTVNVAIPTNPTGNAATPTDCAPMQPCSVPGAITTSAFGAFRRQLVTNTYTDVLPAANFRFDVAKDVVARVAAAKTLARPDFSALGGAVSLEDTNNTGNGGNPNLKPIVSTNLEAGLEWYFAPRSLVSAGVFYMDLKNYVSFGVSPQVFRNIRTGRDEVYQVSSPVNSRGKIKGFELAYSQPLFTNFGANANYTYADAYEVGGGELVGASKNTYNLGGYFENDHFNARVAYSFRSAFFNGLDRSTAQHQDDTGTVSASLGWKISENLSLSLDGLNLNDPKLKYYGAHRDQPTAFYSNGRQFYLMLRGKL